MNTWRNLPGKAFVAMSALDPRLRARARRAAGSLSRNEAALFLSLSRYDLAHSLAVAARLADDPALRKAGLLHDSGKLRSELGLGTRFLLTALEICRPSLLARLYARVEGKARGSSALQRMAGLRRGWRRGLYVQAHHAEIAAELLRAGGSEAGVVELVASHQGEPRGPGQRRLREADDSL